MTRVLQAARLHLIHPIVMLGIPWLVVAISFAINLATWHLTPAGEDDGGFTGGVASFYITLLVIFVLAVTQQLPFAMGLSISRRTFFLGTALVAAALSLVSGIAFTALVAIENATDGWGVQMEYWAPRGLDMGNPVLQVLATAAQLLACAFIGMGIGVVNKRYGQAGTWGLIIGVMVLVGGALLLIAWLEAWSELADWFTAQSAVALALGLPLAVAALAAAVSFPGVRRIVP